MFDIFNILPRSCQDLAKFCQDLPRYPRCNPRFYQEIEDVKIKSKIFSRYSRIQDFPKIIQDVRRWVANVVKDCNGNCPCQNFRSKNSFKSDVALKHASDERPVKKADQKSEIAPAREDEKRRRRKQSLEHGEVPIFGLWRLHYIGNRNRCSRCSPEDPAASCAVTSASAGKPWSIRSC